MSDIKIATWEDEGTYLVNVEKKIEENSRATILANKKFSKENIFWKETASLNRSFLIHENTGDTITEATKEEQELGIKILKQITFLKTEREI